MDGYSKCYLQLKIFNRIFKNGKYLKLVLLFCIIKWVHKSLTIWGVINNEKIYYINSYCMYWYFTWWL